MSVYTKDWFSYYIPIHEHFLSDYKNQKNVKNRKLGENIFRIFKTLFYTYVFYLVMLLLFSKNANVNQLIFDVQRQSGFRLNNIFQSIRSESLGGLYSFPNKLAFLI